jgi:signal transduction histidine kinase
MMQLSPQAQEQLAALADHLAGRRDAILHAWCQAVEADARLTTASTLSRGQFHDHIPEVLDAFEARLKARPGRERAEAEQETRQDAALHGRHRWQQGFRLRELTREWNYLHLVLLDEIEEYTSAHPEMNPAARRTARRNLAQLCGEGVSESADQYFNLRQVEAAGHVRDLEQALEQWAEQERKQGEAWREAAHDLRGSLGVFRNVADILAREALPDQMRAESVGLLQRGVRSMQALLEDVLSLARLQAGQETRRVASFDAATMLGELCASAQPLAQERGLVLAISGPPALPVEGDAVKVRRIVQNLLLNALKYTRRGGVTVAWGDNPNDPLHWVIRVEDTGPGLHTGSDAPLTQALETATEESREVARQEGEQPPASPPHPAATPVTHNELSSIPGGEGIGLSIVKRLCELLDAILEMETQAGVGTTFRVILPRRYTG